MTATTRIEAVLTVLLGLMLGGCVKASLDRGVGYGGRPQDVAVEEVPVKGHQVILKLRDGGKAEGELLAVDQRRLWLRTEGGDQVFGCDEVDEAKVVLYETGATWQWVWAGVLTASMVTHGIWMVVSLPVAAPGAFIAAATSGLFNKLRVKRAELEALYQYARYPAGMPRRAREVPFSEPRPAPPVSRPASMPQVPDADEPGVAPP